MRIAVLEDDLAQSALLKQWLGELGYASVETYVNGASFLSALKKEHFGLIVLDLRLPDISGMEVLQWIRGHMDWKVPVVVHSIVDDEEYIVSALEQGADDYIAKSLSREMTLARIKNVLRRSGAAEESEHVINATPLPN